MVTFLKKDFRKGKCHHGTGMEHRSNGTYRFIKDIALEHAARTYRYFHKLLIVRHPLRHLVSAYYQYLINKRKRETFHDLVKNEALMSQDAHWLDYQSSCHPYVMGYDFILQQENINMEFPYFSQQMGLNPYYPYPRERVNTKADKSNVYRYDNILRNFERKYPNMFRKIIDKYQVDKDMFGYHWTNHTSGRFLDGPIC